MERDKAMKFMRDLLKVLVEKDGSDLFITVGFPPAMKIHGKVTPVSKTKLTAENAKSLCQAIMNDKQLKEFEKSDLAKEIQQAFPDVKLTGIQEDNND